MINVNSLCSLCAVGEKMKKKIAHNLRLGLSFPDLSAPRLLYRSMLL